MEIPIIIEITDKGQNRHDAPNPVIVSIMAADSRLPFFSFECDRGSLHRATRSHSGILNGVKLEGVVRSKK